MEIMWLLAHAFALGGIGLVIHEFLVEKGITNGIFVRNVLDSSGPYLACFSLFLVCASIYYEDAGRTPPSDVSRSMASPFFMLVSIGFLIMTIRDGTLSPHYVDALGMIALGGAMMRLTGVPFSIGPKKAVS